MTILEMGQRQLTIFRQWRALDVVRRGLVLSA